MSNTVLEKTKHTPGPWKIEKYSDKQVRDGERIRSANGLVIAPEVWGASLWECDANYKLIAAAPELLEALRDANNLIVTARNYFPKSVHNHDKFDLENTCAAINKAIHKATE